MAQPAGEKRLATLPRRGRRRKDRAALSCALWAIERGLGVFCRKVGLVLAKSVIRVIIDPKPKKFSGIDPKLLFRDGAVQKRGCLAMQEIQIELTKNPKQKPADQSKLGFGKIFTDHMYVMPYNKEQGWHDPKIVPYQPKIGRASCRERV